MTVNPVYHPDLTSLDQWVNWRFEMREGRKTKIPYTPRSGAKADPTDPATWASFEEAYRVWQSSEDFDGIGFVFSSTDPFVGIDLDHCRDAETGRIDDWAQEIINLLASYVEESPTGTGVHIFVRGSVPGKRRVGEINGHKVEMYESGRYFTVTGMEVRADASSD